MPPFRRAGSPGPPYFLDSRQLTAADALALCPAKAIQRLAAALGALARPRPRPRASPYAGTAELYRFLDSGRRRSREAVCIGGKRWVSEEAVGIGGKRWALAASRESDKAEDLEVFFG